MVKYISTIAVTTLVVGGATYVTVNNQAKDDKVALQTTIDGLTAQVTTLNNKITPPPANQSTDFLVIKELGIKFPLTSQIKDLIYTYDCTNGGGSLTTNCLHFSTISIASIPNSGGQNCGTANDPLGTYNVYSTRQTNEGAGDNQAGTLEATVNGHYIYYHHVQFACGDTPQDQAKVSVLIDPLLTAVKNAQPN